jgi:CRP/FNR family transcriptional regulator
MYAVSRNRDDERVAPGDAARWPNGNGRYAGTTVRPRRDSAAWSAYLASPRARSERLEPHEILFHEDDRADHVYEVASGTVILYRLLSDGRRQVVDILGAGDLFGLSATGFHDCSAESLTTTDVRVLDRRDIEGSSDLQSHVNQCLTHRLEALHSHAVLLGRKSAQERVASFLMRFLPNRGAVGCKGPQEGGDSAVVVLRMTRQEIADYLGLTIETVSRVLSDLKRRGVIAIEKNDRIRLSDVCRVCRLTGMH